MSGSGTQPNGASPLGTIESPDAWASIGRGMTDMYEPAVQAWLNMTDPQRAAAYRALRAENERLYQRGLLTTVQQSQPSAPEQWLSPFAGRPNPYPWMPPRQSKDQGTAPPPDFWREGGRWLAAAPVLAALPASAISMTPEALGSWALTSNAYSALGGLGRKLGWLD